jgi:hypothetical protein
MMKDYGILKAVYGCSYAVFCVYWDWHVHSVILGACPMDVDWYVSYHSSFCFKNA